VRSARSVSWHQGGVGGGKGAAQMIAEDQRQVVGAALAGRMVAS
jgi:hypothetical protein